MCAPGPVSMWLGRYSPLGYVLLHEEARVNLSRASMDPLPRVHLQCASIVMVGVATWVGPRTIHVCTWACFDEVGSLLSVGLGPTKGFRVLLRGSDYY